MDDATYTRRMQADAPDRDDAPAAAGPRSLWDGGPLSPLNIAAYITWLPVSLSMLDVRRLAAPTIEEWLGAACLLGFIALFVARVVLGRDRSRHERWSMAVVLPQGVLALLAIWLLDGGSGAVLLILVAVQLFAILHWRVAVCWQAAFNLGLVLIWRHAFGMGWDRLLIELLPVLGFQAFAALTAYYATAVGHTRDELARVNAELLATQHAARGKRARRRAPEALARVARRRRPQADRAQAQPRALRARSGACRSARRSSSRPDSRDELLDDIRAVVGELRKHDGVDLRAALEILATHRCPAHASASRSPTTRASHSVQAAETLLRCAQEGITNALRHGRPGEIRCGAAVATTARSSCAYATMRRRAAGSPSATG